MNEISQYDVQNHTIQPMTAEAASQISTWEYEEPYGAYSFKGRPLGWLMDEATWGSEQFVLTDGKSLLGQVACQFDGGDMWVGWSMAPELCGKGMGHLFVLKCVSELCRIKGHRGKVKLKVAAGNLRAVRAYEKAGFVAVETVRDEIAYSGHEEDFYVMEKDNRNSVIHIFGASGSGTTTLGRALAEKLGVFHMDTDGYFWLPSEIPFTVKRPAEERIALMREDIEKHGKAVISGAFTGWGDVFIPLFRLAVWVDTPTETRIERLKAREFARFGQRIRPGGDMYGEHLEFIQWASGYDTDGPKNRSRANHEAWVKTLPCPVLCLDGRESVAENCARIVDSLANGNF